MTRYGRDERDGVECMKGSLHINGLHVCSKLISRTLANTLGIIAKSTAECSYRLLRKASFNTTRSRCEWEHKDLQTPSSRPKLTSRKESVGNRLRVDLVKVSVGILGNGLQRAELAVSWSQFSKAHFRIRHYGGGQ